jgi:hypothetical protein
LLQVGGLNLQPVLGGLHLSHRAGVTLGGHLAGFKLECLGGLQVGMRWHLAGFKSTGFAFLGKKKENEKKSSKKDPENTSPNTQNGSFLRLINFSYSS